MGRWMYEDYVACMKELVSQKSHMLCKTRHLVNYWQPCFQPCSAQCPYQKLTGGKMCLCSVRSGSSESRVTCSFSADPLAITWVDNPGTLQGENRRTWAGSTENGKEKFPCGQQRSRTPGRWCWQHDRRVDPGRYTLLFAHWQLESYLGLRRLYGHIFSECLKIPMTHSAWNLETKTTWTTAAWAVMAWTSWRLRQCQFPWHKHQRIGWYQQRRGSNWGEAPCSRTLQLWMSQKGATFSRLVHQW